MDGCGCMVNSACNMLLLTSEAAKLLDLTPAAVRRLELVGQLRAIRTPSGVRLFERSEVNRLAAARRKPRRVEHLR